MESEASSEEIMERFHHIVSKLVYVSKLARVEVELVVPLLCMKVFCSTKDDWESYEGNYITYMVLSIYLGS